MKGSFVMSLETPRRLSARLSDTELQITAAVYETPAPWWQTITVVRSNASFKEMNEVYYRLALHSHPNRNLPNRGH